MQIMGIINLSPDSFWESSRCDAGIALKRIARMLDSGVDLFDIGAVSTRPGAGFVSEREEWRRLEPLLKALPCGLKFSLDTTRSSIVRRAFDVAGRFIVNDISAGEEDPGMLPTAVELGLGYIAMHKRGNPLTMDSLCAYPHGVVTEVAEYFRSFSRRAAEAGLEDWILDPGFGFAKTDGQNMELLRSLRSFREFGRPVLVGISHKRFTIGRERECNELAKKGADIMRVHEFPFE